MPAPSHTLLLQGQTWHLFQPWGNKVHAIHGYRHVAEAPGEELTVDQAVKRIAFLRQGGYKAVKRLPWS